MAKISINLPDEQKERLDAFLQKSSAYRNRSEFIRQAVEQEISDRYSVLRRKAGSWSDETAEKVRESVDKLDQEDLAAQQRE